MTRPPARPGDSLGAVATPALILDLDAFEANITAMQQLTASAGVSLRPHGKAHRCSAIAKAQVAAGAVGICCQTVGEAESFAQGNTITDILVSNVVVDPSKLARLAILSRQIRIAVCVDDVSVVDGIAEAAKEADAKIEVLVELDVGDHRLGVAEAVEVVGIASAVASASHLTFGGLQAYLGSAQHERDPAERRRLAAHGADAAGRIRDVLVGAGFACPRITGGGTGTVASDCPIGTYTEVQPGSYIFLDADYARNGIGPDDIGFQQSLFILTTVISTAVPGHVICDAGLKSFSMESGLPRVANMPGLEAVRVSDEHLRVACHDARRPNLRERIMLAPGHCDPTVNLHDWIVGLRSGQVQAVWPIDARGASA